MNPDELVNSGRELKFVLEVLNLDTLEETQTELFFIVSRSFLKIYFRNFHPDLENYRIWNILNSFGCPCILLKLAKIHLIVSISIFDQILTILVFEFYQAVSPLHIYQTSHKWLILKKFEFNNMR